MANPVEAGTAGPAAASPPESRSKRKIWAVMAGLMITMLLAQLDNTIISPALPTIVGDLGGLEHLSWVTTAYILATTAATLLWGKLGDLYSRKAVFMASISIFLIGSMLAGLAQSMTQLIAFRAIQGVGAGGLMVGAISVIAVLVSPRDRGRYTGYMVAVMPVALIAGPLIGGFITDNLSWRWNLYINVPLGLIALVVIAATMKLPATNRAGARIDWLGAALVTIWTTSLVLVTSWGGSQYAWDSSTILGLIALTVVALAAFIVVETRVKEPILPLRVFTNLNFSLAGALSFIVGLALFGGITFLPQFQQYVQGQTATASGLLLLPLMAGVLVMSVASGQIMSRTGQYRMFPIGGSLLMAVGLGLLATVTVDTGVVVTSVYMVVLGLGMGSLMQITTTIGQNSVPLRDVGAATGAITFLRSMGGSLGVSLLGSLYTARLTDSLTSRLGSDGAALLSTTLTPQTLLTLPVEVQDAFRVAVTHGITGVFFWGAVAAAAGFVIALFIRQVPLRDTLDEVTTDTRVAKSEPESELEPAIAGR